ncbi:MAG: TRAP transporter substrate-binding protein DctP [Deltaproteobacteria bacterium]|nr:TRAP transporter substrate-binding protein DctP [Deltaproteobacteria bacterium]MBW2341905.1 TRAP transporter substrate-binding protein DctP [Deltaproteobacteria bacterium]
MRHLSINKLNYLLFAITLAMMLCAGPVISKAQAKEKVWKLQIQLFTVPGKWDAQWVVPMKFAEFIKKHTKGRVVCSMHPVGELVGPREIWTSVSAGTIDGGATLNLYEGGTHPEFCFDFGPIATIDEYFKVMHAGALDILSKQALRENVRIFGYFPLVPYAAFSMKNEFVKTLDDLKGKKIRGMGGAGNLFLKAVGAGIVTLPMSEVPAALQTGVVDGIHTGLAGLYAMHLWDVAPYFTPTKSGCFAFLFLLDEDLYKEFPPDIKAGIASAQRDLEQWYPIYDRDFRNAIIKDTEQKGVKWYFLSPKEDDRCRELLSDASVSWVTKREPDIGRKLYAIIEKTTGQKVLK